MKNIWLKYWGIVIISTIALYSIFQTLPNSFILNINLHQDILDTSWTIVGVSLLAMILWGLCAKVSKKIKLSKKSWHMWKMTTSVIATILIFISILYLSFPISGRVIPSPLFDSNKKDISISSYDDRCIFMPGYFRITKENGSSYFSLDVGEVDNPAYKNKLGRAFYFSDKNMAIAEGHNSSQLALLDFKNCLLTLISPEFKVKSTEDAYFGQSFISISPDEKHILFEVDLRFVALPFDDSWPISVNSDVPKYGFWIYNLQTKKSTQIYQIKNAIDTSDVNTKWGTNTLTVMGADCPKNGCLFNLSKY